MDVCDGVPENAATNGNVHVWNAGGKGLVVLWPNPGWEAFGGLGDGSSCTSGKVVAIVIEVEEGRGPRPEEQWRWKLWPPSLPGMRNLSVDLVIGPDPNAARPGLTEQDIDFLTADPARAEYFERVVHGIPDGEVMRRCADCRRPLGPNATTMFHAERPEEHFCIDCGRQKSWDAQSKRWSAWVGPSQEE